ncbi:hypothetical protein B0H10DRAFT_2120652 [Mycena sp. CBHHK59/15]|nr:hypothetical protein B0H10DRAFT_2120652 [Mycena sp. CBHHK59/15]
MSLTSPEYTITYTAYFRGCIMKPDRLQMTCCTQVGGTPANVNGTFGCPYDTAFVNRNYHTTTTTWLACCTSNNCHSALCTDGGIDSAYQSSSASPADSTSTSEVPSTMPKPNSGPLPTQGSQTKLIGVLLAGTLFSVFVRSL